MIEYPGMGVWTLGASLVPPALVREVGDRVTRLHHQVQVQAEAVHAAQVRLQQELVATNYRVEAGMAALAERMAVRR